MQAPAAENNTDSFFFSEGKEGNGKWRIGRGYGNEMVMRRSKFRRLLVTLFLRFIMKYFLKKTLVFPEGSYFLQLFSSNPAPADRRGGAGKAGSSCFLLPLPPPPPPEVEESRKGGGEGKGHFGKHPSFPDCQSKKKMDPRSTQT